MPVLNNVTGFLTDYGASARYLDNLLTISLKAYVFETILENLNLIAKNYFVVLFNPNLVS